MLQAFDIITKREQNAENRESPSGSRKQSLIPSGSNQHQPSENGQAPPTQDALRESKLAEFDKKVIDYSESKKTILDGVGVIVRAHGEYISKKTMHVHGCLLSIDTQDYIPKDKIFVYSDDGFEFPESLKLYLLDNGWKIIKTHNDRVKKLDIAIENLDYDTIWCHTLDCDDLCPKGFYKVLHNTINTIANNNKVCVLVPKLIYIGDEITYRDIDDIAYSNQHNKTANHQRFVDASGWYGYVDTDSVWYVPAVRMVGGFSNNPIRRCTSERFGFWDDLMLAKSLIDIGYDTYYMNSYILKRDYSFGNITKRAREAIKRYGGVNKLVFDMIGCNIITLFGKTYCAEAWLERFASLELPANTDIWWVASYQHKPDTKYLYRMAERLCYPVNIVNIPTPRLSENSYISRGQHSKNRPKTNSLFHSDSVVHRNFVVNYLYNNVLSIIKASKPFTIFLEDDVYTNDTYALYKLIEIFDIGELSPVGAVGAPVFSINNHICGCLHGEDAVKHKNLPVMELFGVNGPAAFVAYPTHLIKNLLPINTHQVLVKPELSDDGKIKSLMTDIKTNHSYHCWDLEFGMRLRENGYRTYIRHDINTIHHLTPYCKAIGSAHVEVNKSNVKRYYPERKPTQ